MHERLRLLRKSLRLTQQQFAERIGVKRNTIAQYEMGRNEPIESVLISICREFNVNETWLRIGKGEMFIELDPEDELMQWAGMILKSKPNSFKKRFVRMLSQMSDEEWEWVEEKLLQLFAKTREEPEPVETVPIKQPDLLAAHQRTDQKATPEGQKHDRDIMMNDDEWE